MDESGEAIWAEKAWQIMESSKAFRMQLSLGKQEALVASGVPVQQRLQLDSLEKQLAWQESAYYEALKSGDSLRARQKLEDFFSSRQVHQQLENRLEQEIPVYLKLKSPPPPVELRVVQDSLKKSGEKLLTWFPGYYHLYVLCLNGDSLFLTKDPRKVGRWRIPCEPCWPIPITRAGTRYRTLPGRPAFSMKY